MYIAKNISLSLHENVLLCSTFYCRDLVRKNQLILSDFHPYFSKNKFRGFSLNEKRTRAKKRKACDRNNYKIKQNRSSSTVIFSTVAFEFFKYLTNQSYGYLLTESKDIPGNVTHDILKVFTTVNQISNLYTVNLYRTTSSILTLYSICC